MKKLAIAAVLAGTFGLAAPALAGPGQCYDHYGRPIGPVYDTDHPNYGFINSVIRNGGSCTGVQADYNPYPSYRSNGYGYDYQHRPRYHDYGYQQRPHYRGNSYQNQLRRYHDSGAPRGYEPPPSTGRVHRKQPTHIPNCAQADQSKCQSPAQAAPGN